MEKIMRTIAFHIIQGFIEMETNPYNMCMGRFLRTSRAWTSTSTSRTKSDPRHAEYGFVMKATNMS